MKTEGDAKLVTIYVNSTDQWHGRSLYSAIVQLCERQGIAGAALNKSFAVLEIPMMLLKSAITSRFPMQSRSERFAGAAGSRPVSAWKAFLTVLLRAFSAWAI